jgi:hypothetical protein
MSSLSLLKFTSYSTQTQQHHSTSSILANMLNNLWKFHPYPDPPLVGLSIKKHLPQGTPKVIDFNVTF